MRADAFDPSVAQLKKNEKRDMKYFSLMAALCVCGYIILSQAAAIAIGVLGLRKYINTSETGYESFSMLMTVFCLLVPFLFAAHFEKKRTDIDICPLDKPDSPLLMVLSVPAGAAICILGSVATSYISLIFSSSGVTLTQPDISSPTAGYALVIYLLRLTFVPALIEEVCFRGILMQPLRKYGNFFAIIMSAMIFALVHCNLVQAPAAFISGIGIGYFTVATGTLWTGVCIHLLNNLLVAVSQYYLSCGNEDFALAFTNIASNAVMVIGLICLVLFLVLRKTARLDGGMRSTLSRFEKARAYILTPAMIAAFLMIAYIMSDYIKA